MECSGHNAVFMKKIHGPLIGSYNVGESKKLYNLMMPASHLFRNEHWMKRPGDLTCVRYESLELYSSIFFVYSIWSREVSKLIVVLNKNMRPDTLSMPNIVPDMYSCHTVKAYMLVYSLCRTPVLLNIKPPDWNMSQNRFGFVDQSKYEACYYVQWPVNSF